MNSFSVIVPDGPMVTVHKGWRVPSSRPGTASSSLPLPEYSDRSVLVDRLKSSPIGRQYEFVNAVKPGRNLDPEVRKLVRKHVRNEHVRNTLHPSQVPPRKLVPHVADPSNPGSGNNQSSALLPTSSASSIPNAGSQATSPRVPRNIGYPTALLNFEFPIEMNASVHMLLDQYLKHAPRRLYPLESCLRTNPLRSPEWFQYAIRDAAMLHGMLYAGSLYLALLEGKTGTKDSMHHLGHVVSIVKKRLNESDGGIEDSTLGAISCLALGEAITGNKDLWQTHMLGLKQMIIARRSIDPLPALLQAKLRRSDITGAIDYAATPLLDFDRSNRPPTWALLSAQTIGTTDREMKTVLTRCGVHPSLITTMTELACFSQAIHLATEASVYFDPTTFSEDLYWLEYNFLAFAAKLPGGSTETETDKACRLGALLYLKAILQEFPHSANGSSLLLAQMRTSLTGISMQASNSPLLLWLCLVGGSLSELEERPWFVDCLAQIRMVSLVPSFDDIELDLSRMLGLKRVFGRTFETLWNETLVRNGTFFS
ncbi:hypothetical protein LOCC1_G002080 [Lachnellula occidentalis]|uniref:Uncharacterized protein n=1 Tax=Lachnellula occidentalis TaxID=215460 RepID=A0A8H8UKJ3_9HELO|nr:hypothetical protein LOCC1_G002080 [Lachnellula occidentalis]